MTSAITSFRVRAERSAVEDDRRGTVVSILLVAASMAVASWTLLPAGSATPVTPAPAPAAASR